MFYLATGTGKCPFVYFKNLFPLTCLHVGAICWLILGNFSKDVSERRTSPISVLFAFFDIGFAHTFEQIVSIRVKERNNTNLVVSRHISREKNPLPVDVRRSKTPLIKFPIPNVYRLSF